MAALFMHRLYALTAHCVTSPVEVHGQESAQRGWPTFADDSKTKLIWGCPAPCGCLQGAGVRDENETKHDAWETMIYGG